MKNQSSPKFAHALSIIVFLAVMVMGSGAGLAPGPSLIDGLRPHAQAEHIFKRERVYQQGVHVTTPLHSNRSHNRAPALQHIFKR